MLSISLTPVAGVNDNGKYNYAEEKRASTAIKLSKIKTLMTGINEFILPAIEKVRNGESVEGTNVGVEINKNALFIEYKKDETDNKYKVSLVLYINITPDNTCSTYVKYNFNQNTLITNYNNESGTGSTGEVESEFLLFVDILNHMIDSMGISHHGDAMTRPIERTKASSTIPIFGDDDMPF